MSRRPPLPALVCALVGALAWPLALAPGGAGAAGSATGADAAPVAEAAARRAAAGTAAAPAADAAAARRARRDCPPPGAGVVARSPEALVFARAGSEAFVGCLRNGAARPRLLTTAQDPDDPYSEHFAGSWAIAGRTVAWQQLFLPGESCRYGADCPAQRLDVRAVTLPDGRLRRYRAQRLWALAAGRSGVVAWVDGLEGEQRSVRAAGSRGSALTLDTSERIDRRSLRVRGTTVHWRSDGRARTAQVPAGAPPSPRR